MKINELNQSLYFTCGEAAGTYNTLGEKIGRGSRKQRIVFEATKEYSSTYIAYREFTGPLKYWNQMRVKVGLDVPIRYKGRVISLNVNSLAKRLHLFKNVIRFQAKSGKLGELITQKHLEKVATAAPIIGYYESEIKPGSRSLDCPQFKFLNDIIKVVEMRKSVGNYYPEDVNAQVKQSEGQAYPIISFDKGFLAEGSYGSVDAFYQTFQGDIVRKTACQRNNYANQEAIDSLTHEYEILRELHAQGIVEGLQLPALEIAEEVDPLGRVMYVMYSIKYKYGCLNKTRPSEYADVNLRRVRSLARGLKHLHTLNIRHGDIKPANIFVSDTRCDLADLGDAHKLEDLKKLFDEGRKKIIDNKSYSDTKRIRAYFKLHCNLFGTYSKHWYNSNDDSVFVESIQRGDWQQYCAISKARDVYALGLSLVDYFTKESRNANHFGTLDLRARLQFEMTGFSDEQIEMIERMIAHDYRERPTAEEVEKMFR